MLTLSRNSLVHVENDAAAVLDSQLVLSDADHPTLASASLRFASGFEAAEDTLLFANDGLSMGNIVASFSGATLSLSSAGATATVAEWQSALRSVAYHNSSEAPNTTSRVLSLTVNDGIADSATRSFTIALVSVNDAPVLLGSNSMAAIDEDDSANAGTLVATLIAGQSSDIDSAAVAGIAVIGVDDSFGQWQYSRDGGVSWAGLGGASEGNARLLAADALSAVRFVPAADWNGSVGAGLSYRAWDQSTGVAGGTADAALNGGAFAFSSASASSGIVVLPMNDAPVLSGADDLAAIDEDDGSSAGTPVSVLIAGHSSDIDAGALVGIAITAADTGNGHWQFSTDGGTSWADLGAVGVGAARLLTADAGSVLRFVPDTDWNGSVDPALSFRAWDRSSGNAGDLADTTVSGGSTAFSADQFSSRLTVRPINDAPESAEALADQVASEDVAFVFTVPGDTFSDADAGDVLSYSATLAGGAALPAWLSFDAATVTFSGTPGAADVGTITLRITATDGAGASTYGDFDLTVAAVNDAPLLAQALAPQTATQDTGFVFTLPSGTFVDNDAGDTLSYRATLADGAALPAWLSFDASTGTFSGTPGNGDVGVLTLSVTATDTAGASVSTPFELTVNDRNDAPRLANPIVAMPAVQDLSFGFTLPPGTFTDVDRADTLTFSATLADGSALPTWLRFDATTQRFSGTPANADVGQVLVRVHAVDAAGAAAHGDFALKVANVNDAPQLALPIADLDVAVGAVLNWTFAAPSFTDIDVGDTLRYEATRADGTALPTWLRFDAATRSFVGSPQADDAGALVVRLVAIDAAGAAAQTLFAVRVAAAPPAPPVPAPPAPPVPAPAAEVLVPMVIAEALPPPAPAAPVAKEPAAPEAAPTPPPPAAVPEALPMAAAPAEVTGAADDGLSNRDTAASPEAAQNAASRSAGSRADAVLAEALVPQFGDITLAPMAQLLQGGELTRSLDEVKRQLTEQAEARRGMMASSIAVTSGLSVGYVIWLVRGGVLMSSMLSALPAWQMIDPLPVLAASGSARKARGKDAAGDDGEVERLFEQGTASRPTPARLADAAIAAAKAAPAAAAAEPGAAPPRPKLISESS